MEICKYVWSCNSNIQIKINTNGGTRNVQFWKELGEIFALYKHTGSVVSFSVDGLEDTNHLYRVGVVWSKLMSNVKAFLSTGALAEWTFIPFKHNQHQFDEIKRLHKEMGFVKTNIQQSRRFDQWGTPAYTYLHNGTTHYLEPPDSEYFLKKKKHKKQSTLNEKCLLYHRKEIYVDCFGNVFPCCWYGTIHRRNIKNSTSLYFSSIESIVEREFVQSRFIKSTWANPNSLCNSHCWVLE